MTTTNFADFGYREREIAKNLLSASCEFGFPEDFEQEGITIMFNQLSGEVFFTNSEFQVCMLDEDGRLQSFYNTPYSGFEGFASELLSMYRCDPDGWHKDDIEFLSSLGIL